MDNILNPDGSYNAKLEIVTYRRPSYLYSLTNIRMVNLRICYVRYIARIGQKKNGCKIFCREIGKVELLYLVRPRYDEGFC